jgi:hypothetical protein
MYEQIVGRLGTGSQSPDPSPLHIASAPSNPIWTGAFFIGLGIFCILRFWWSLGSGEITESNRPSNITNSLLDFDDNGSREKTYSAQRTPIAYWLDILTYLAIGIALIGLGIYVIFKKSA